MPNPLINIIEQFGKDRYWQPGWSKELARMIAKHFDVVKKGRNL